MADQNPTTPETDYTPLDPLRPEFWRERPHLFVPAGWGPQFCRACHDADGGPIHDVQTDPATHVGNCTGYRVARPVEILYAVNGWSDDGAACSFGAKRTIEEAYAFIESGQAVRSDGRPYDHYQIDQRTYYTACDTNVLAVSPPASEGGDRG